MKRVAFLASVALTSMLSVSAFAQNAGGGGGNPGGGGNNPGGGTAGGNAGGGRQRGNNGQPGGGQDWRQGMLDRIKEQMGATDEEFKALQPKIEKVQTLQMQSRFGGFGGRGRGGPGGGGGNNPGGGNQPAAGQPAAPANPVAEAGQALRTTLDNKDASAADIKAKLDALRAAKSKSNEELAAAQKELKELLSQRQEAVLVQMSILD